MLKRIFLIVLIFSLLIVNIDGETIWEQDFDLGSINVENKVSTATTNPITIHQSGEVMITLTGKIPENSTFQNYIVCISYGAEPLNEPSSWEKGGCISQDPNNLYFELSDATQFNINLRDNTLRDIFVSVSVDDLSALNPIDNVKLKLTGLDCGDYAINVKGICFGYYNLTRGNLYSYNTKAEDWSYFAITIPSEQNTSYAIFKNYLNSNFYSNNPQESYIRYGAPPTNEIYDQKGVPSFNDSLDIEIALDSPIPGNYIIGVYNKNDTVVSSFYVWEYSTCKSGEAGPNCDDPVISLKNQSYLGEQTIQPGKWVYYIVEANDSLIFYTIANNETDNAPNAYARLIGFPSSTSYNIASTGKRINILDSSEIPTTSVLQNFVFDNQKPSNKKITRNWYIGLFNPTLKNITFGTWINTDCPNSCENNGKCEDHLCLCNSDKDVDAITCASTHEGFKVEYIILIVVGSCIILTGIIGIIVYLHRRRNRHTYESF